MTILGIHRQRKTFFPKKKLSYTFYISLERILIKYSPPAPHPARSASLFDKRIVLKLKGASINNFIDAFFVFKSLRISRLI